MRRQLIIFGLLFLVLLTGCESNQQDKELFDDIFSKAQENLVLPSETSVDLQLDKEITVNEYKVSIEWITDNEALDNQGIVTRGLEDIIVTMSVKLSLENNGSVYQKIMDIGQVKVLKMGKDEYLSLAYDKLTLPETATTDLEFVEEVEIAEQKIKVEWITDNSAISSSGKVSRDIVDINVNVKVKLTFLGEILEKNLGNVKVLKIDNTEEYFEEALKSIDISDEVYCDLSLPKVLKVNEQSVEVVFSFSSDIIDSNGKVTFAKEDVLVKVFVDFKFNSEIVKKEVKEIKVLGIEKALEKMAEEIEIPSEVNKDLVLPTMIGKTEVFWSSNNKKILSDSGLCAYTSSPVNVVLTVTLFQEIDGESYFFDKQYKVVVKPYDYDFCIEKILKEINIPSSTSSNIKLATEFKYDVTGEWSSSDEKIVSTIGNVNPTGENTEVTLQLALTYQNETILKDYVVVINAVQLNEGEVYFAFHNLVDRVQDFDMSKTSNLVKNSENKLVLATGALEGKYESKVFVTKNFESLVGSYSCITDKYSSSELEISIRINGVWSKYFTYGKWSLGKDNYYYNQTDTYSKMNIDEIMVTNGSANAIKYRFTIKRDDATKNSPVLSLIAFCLEIPGYTYNVNSAKFPSSADNPLPKLYQYDVPTIGGSICSATTTTMLLKNKGFDFTDKGYEYEHQFMAMMVADPGHNSPTYGNWSYNMITAGAFGVDAYVARMYSWDEVREFLVNVGPIGASIKGTFGSYSTNGHLIVVRGYRVENGNTTVICNDPAIRNVYYEVTLQTFMNCWRGVCYVIE